MFGIGSTELLVILVVALIVLGPKSIPGIAKTLGKVMGEFRRVSTEFQRTMNAEVAQDEHEKRKKEAEEELFGTKASMSKAEAATPAQAAAAAPSPVAPAMEDTPPPASAATVDAASADAASVGAASVDAASADAASVDATTGVPLSPDSPLAQAVARAEAEARGSVPAAAVTTVDTTPTATATGASSSGEKA